MCSRPLRSPTMVGSAVETIVWSSAASSTASTSPRKTRLVRRGPTAGRASTAASAGSFFMRYILLDTGFGRQPAGPHGQREGLVVPFGLVRILSCPAGDGLVKGIRGAQVPAN